MLPTIRATTASTMLAIVLVLASCSARTADRVEPPAPAPGICVAAIETCDGVDNDCNGGVDDTPASACGACGPRCRDERSGVPGGSPFDPARARAGGLRVTEDGALELTTERGGRADLIWIVNTPEGTVSKIDTRTYEELGRYVTGPDLGNDPSRTSVDGRGDVYIGNRSAHTVTKISAAGDDCPDTNHDGVVTTSNGGRTLPWGQDDCVLWNVSLGDSAIRGIAAQEMPGLDGVGASVVWVGSSAKRIWKLDGQTGAVLVDTEAPVLPYGLALDGRGNLWVAPHGAESTGGSPFSGDPGAVFLGRVDTNLCTSSEACDVAPCGDDGDACVKQRVEYPEAVPSYGITVDRRQRVWLGGRDIRRYDPMAPLGERWIIARPHAAGLGVVGGSAGIAADGDGSVWAAMANEGVLRLDAEDPSRMIVVPGTRGRSVKGVAVDTDGKVWAINMAQSDAYVVTPGAELETATVESHVAPFIVAPYVYSDMTGMQLRLATGLRGSYREVFECARGREGTIADWRTLSWDATVPPDTSVQWKVRTADTREALAGTPWIYVPARATTPVDLRALLRDARVTPGLVLEVEVELGAWASLDGATPTLRSFGAVYVCPTTLF